MQSGSWGFIGAGRITRIILTGMKKTGKLPEEIVVSDGNDAVLSLLQKDFPEIVNLSADNTGPASCDLIFISLHPPVLADVLKTVSSFIKPEAVVVSLAPRLTLAKLSDVLNGHKKIVRMIPNAPSIVNRGYNPVAFAEGITVGDKDSILELFHALGECPEVAEENLEAYAIIAAMGPTYFWFQWQTLVELARSFGLSDAEINKAVPKMIEGAVQTMFASNLSPEEVMDLVPVRPLADEEETIRETYRTRLSSLFYKLKG
jgi:pyrroline-5-carboxylate reductase